jgi:hypothetical protein
VLGLCDESSVAMEWGQEDIVRLKKKKEVRSQKGEGRSEKWEVGRWGDGVCVLLVNV